MFMQTGVSFPTSSTTSTARQIVADAFSQVAPDQSRAANEERDWRKGYLGHFVDLVQAGLTDPQAATSIARDGLASAHEQMRWNEDTLSSAFDENTPDANWTTITGTAAPERELRIPYRGEWLHGDALVLQLEDWVNRDIITRSCADAVAEVLEHPEWLDLEGQTVVVLGAGSEMGPYRTLLRWGADVIALDLPRPQIQQRLLEQAESGAGRVRMLTSTNGEEDEIGVNILHDLPAIARALDGLDEKLVLGNYTYADGGTHTRLSVAADALAAHLLERDPDTALAFLATPTDVFAVPKAEVVAAHHAHERTSSLLRIPARLLSGGTLMKRNYPTDAEPGICDALVPQQGPNYALAKRLQRWRATAALADGHRVSLNVAPATRTRSVVKNRALAAAYAGAHRFGIEVFEPATSNVLMTALLVHDLRAGRRPETEPWREEAHGAAHGGLWTAAYQARSALGLAALLGLGSARA